jgi:membrane protein DedA with SNARE-associated domain
MIDVSALQVDSPASYLVALVVPTLDAVVPILPSETVVIALGVATAGSVDPRIGVLVALAALGAFFGDNLSYLLGRRFGQTVERHFFGGEKGKHRKQWAAHALETYGTRLIVVCRFIPGGRTAVTLTCGLIAYPRRRFIPATVASGVIWACYAFFIGRIGGKTFEDRQWLGLVLALGAALVVSLIVEVVRRVVAHRRGRRSAAAPSASIEIEQQDP